MATISRSPSEKKEEEEEEEEEDGVCHIQSLPDDSLHQIFSHLPLREVLACRCVCRRFRETLACPPFIDLVPPLRLLALRHPHRHASSADLHCFDPSQNRWIRLPLAFLPFPSSVPVTASPSLLYLWADSSSDPKQSAKTLVLCNPLTRSFRALPQLGSAWSRHGTVLAAATGHVLVLAELAALWFAPGSPQWLTFSLGLPSKPRSPVLVGDAVFVLCDVGSPWRSQWKLFSCQLREIGGPRVWDRIEQLDWGDVLEILKRPRLIRGTGQRRILMVGGLRSSFAVDAPCSTVLILRLDLGSLEWDEAGRMPVEMYRCFGGAGAAGGLNKVKVFGADGRVWFSGRKVKGRLAMWEEDDARKPGGEWRWVDGAPGHGDGVYRGFVFNADLGAVP
ncbi:F-box family protein [Wolffia australiana]